jgi:ubiquinone biosynthesis protein COQ4
MTPDPLAIPPPPPLRNDWPRAWRSLRALLADSDDTERAMDFEYAAGRRDFERCFQRFVASPGGRAALAARIDLARALADRTALEQLSAESLGRAYLDYLDRNGFRSTGLLELAERVQTRWEAEDGVPPPDPARAWFRDRFILTHDLLHVLTDYGTDDVGEATLLAFSLAQQGGAGSALLTLGAAFEVWRALGAEWLRYGLRAWQRGRRAAWLVGLPWEDLLPLRLDTVRRLAGIVPADEAHPGGILRATLG